MDSIYSNGSYAGIAALFGGGSQQSGHGFMDSIQRFTNVAQIADSVKQTLCDVTNDYNFGSFARKVKAATNQMNAVFDTDTIRPCRTIKEMQVAKPMMQRVISTHPLIKQKILAGECAGYDDYEYDNNHIGILDNNYQSARNGVLCSDKNHAGDDRYGMTTYHNSNGLASLSVYEKHYIDITFRNLEKSLEDDLRDPTSKWNELMQ